MNVTLLACGEAVVRFVNSSPRTPTAEQITNLIRATLREGFDNDPEEEEDGETTIFGPVSLTLDKNDLNYRLTTYQFGLAILGKDEAGLRKSIQGLIGDELAGTLEPDCIDRIIADLEVCQEKFEAMAHFVEVAKARLGLAALKMAEVQYVPDGGLTKAVMQAGGHRP